jgi:hypothetical protein
MGNLAAKNSFENKYYTSKIKRAKNIKNPKVYVKESTIPGAGEGLFTEEALSKGSLLSVEPDLIDKINDPMFQLDQLRGCNSNYDFMNKWRKVGESYHNKEKAKQVVNCKLVIDENDGHFLLVLRNIGENEELFRCYSFTTWLEDIKSIHDIFNPNNIGGFVQFLSEWIKVIGGEELHSKLSLLHGNIRNSLVSIRSGITNIIDIISV